MVRRLGVMVILTVSLLGFDALAQTMPTPSGPAAVTTPKMPVGFKDIAKMPPGPQQHPIDPTLIPATAQEHGHKHTKPPAMTMPAFNPTKTASPTTH